MDVLPDSRLSSSRGEVLADWPLPNGKTMRLTLQPIYCFNCGKPNGYVPKETVSFVSWLCLPCAEKYGEQAALWQSSDQEFWRAVGEEMRVRFGRALTQQELNGLAE